MRRLQLSRVFLVLTGIGALIAIAGIVLLFTSLNTLAAAALPIGIVTAGGALIATAMLADREEKQEFSGAHVADARITQAPTRS